MRMYDVILKKRNGEELTKEEIDFFVQGFTKGEIADYQASALLMAIYFKGMNKRETAYLTMSMVNSGDVLNLDEINGIKVDKHSTGGVGDTTTILLAPLVASLGVPIAKMSGRGLGHTGGTIDKLEAFTGFSVELSREEFIKNVNVVGLALVSQSGNLAPADKKIYALRDVTATVNSMPLIASSIMSKKIVSGADAIVLDVKVGDGAFMKTVEEARLLAREMVDIGKNLGRNTIAIISDMDQPLGYAIGNSLEIIEAINTLKGNGPKDLLELTLVLGANMLILANKAESLEEGKRLLMENVNNLKALKKLKEFVVAQGGNGDLVDNVDLFIKAPYILDVRSRKTGYIKKIHSEELGIIAMKLGAGRETKEDNIDLAVGIVLEKKRGDKVTKGEVIAKVHANNINKGNAAIEEILSVIDIDDNYINDIPLIYEIVK